MSTRGRELGPSTRSARVRLLPPPRLEASRALEPVREAAPRALGKPARGALSLVEAATLREVPPLAPRRPRPGALRFQLVDQALEHEVIPDSLVRVASRHGAWARERRESRGGIVAQEERLRALLRRMSSGPIAERTATAGDRRQELVPEVAEFALGPRRKLSGCLWEPATETLAQAEEAMLALTCLRAQIRDGMRILDLGCGWGSHSLWLAERYPACHVTGVSNSSRHRAWIEVERGRRNLRNLDVVTSDVNDFAPSARFDRVMSIEMFELMRNWRELLRRISTWLRDDGKAFIHMFTHRSLPYRVEGTWAAERSFTGGVMPSHDLLPRFQEHLVVGDRWVEPGLHYAKTMRAWLTRLDAHADETLDLLIAHGRSRGEARAVLAGWRVFLLAADELCSYGEGNHWLISHYLLEPRPTG